MTDRVETTFVSLRRRYRQARIARAMRRASTEAHQRGERVVHMLHVRKTGGTAIQTALKAAGPVPGLLLLLHAHGISLADVPDEDEVFFFLRDPVARFVSGFEMRRQEGGPRYKRPWTTAERMAFERFDSARALATALGSDDARQRSAARRAMTSVADLEPVATWLGTEALVRARRDRIVLVGWQERLDADFAALVELLGLPATAALPTGAYEANRNESDSRRRELAAEAADDVRGWYADDYGLIEVLEELGLTVPPFG